MEIVISLIAFVLWGAFIFLLGWMFWRIFKKAGYHGALGILCLVPIANIIMLAILAFKEWPIQKQIQLKEGGIPQPKSLPAPLIVVIVICALFPIIALLAAIAIPNLLRARITANESSARATIKAISTALETYAASHNQEYPSDEYELVSGAAPFLSQTYNNKTIYGYNYSLKLYSSGYEIEAKPSECGASGTKIVIGETRGKIYDKDCK